MNLVRMNHMTRLGLLVTGLLALSPHPARTDDDQNAALEQFERSVAEYVAVRTIALARLGPLEGSDDMGAIRRAIEARGTAIAQARNGAVAGDLFSPRVARVFRARIQAVLNKHGLSPAVLLEAVDDESRAASPVLVVNGPFPWRRGTGNVAAILAVLPTLPDALQYRFVHTSLVLVDTEANLIVDIIPDAIVIPVLT